MCACPIRITSARHVAVQEEGDLRNWTAPVTLVRWQLPGILSGAAPPSAAEPPALLCAPGTKDAAAGEALVEALAKLQSQGEQIDELRALVDSLLEAQIRHQVRAIKYPYIWIRV